MKKFYKLSMGLFLIPVSLFVSQSASAANRGCVVDFNDIDYMVAMMEEVPPLDADFGLGPAADGYLIVIGECDQRESSSGDSWCADSIISTQDIEISFLAHQFETSESENSRLDTREDDSILIERRSDRRRETKEARQLKKDEKSRENESNK